MMWAFVGLLLAVFVPGALVLAVMFIGERTRRRKAESAAMVAEAARLDAVEAVGLAGEARRTLRAEHEAATSRMTAGHVATIAELAQAHQWREVTARTHAAEVNGLKADLTAARRTIDRLEDQRSVMTELARGIVTESEK